MQTSRGRRGGGMRGKLLLLHQQCLVQLALMLLDLLLHVGDCTCNLDEKERCSQRVGWSWNVFEIEYWGKSDINKDLCWWRVENQRRTKSLSHRNTVCYSTTSKVFSWEPFKAWAIHTLTSCGGCCHMRNYAMFCEEKKSPFTSAHMESHSWSHILRMLWCVDSLAALVVEWGQKHCVAPASSAAGFVNAGTPSL